ncbi:MAG TPA: hypothetical protein VN364_14565 [Bellilinea sp.]|nr:hypothetical protein [Bellilinea sp.]
MKLHGRIWRGAALALLFLVLTSSVGFSQSDTQSDTQAELQAVPPGWRVETVDDGRIFGKLGQNSLAYGPGGVPHVAYGADHLYHAYRAGGNWVVELVDSSPQVGKQASIAVDSLGHVYITYYDELNQNLKYATNWKGWWEVVTLASAGDVGAKSFVFAIMGGGQQGPNVYVGYLNATTYKVMFMYSEEEMMGYWSDPEIASGSLNVSNFAMTMHGYQAYVSLASGGNIYYATSTNWSGVELVGEGQAITAIAVTDDGTPYIPISYDETYVPWGWITYLAYRENNNWVSPTQDTPYGLIFSLGDDIQPEALSIQADGNEVYVAIQLPGSNASYHNLYIAHGAKEIYLGDHYTVQVDAYGEIFPAVAVSPGTIDLKAGVVYLNGNLLEYQFLPSMTDIWSKSISPVDTSSSMGRCTVLRTDNNGRAHVLYSRSDTGALYYKFSTPTGLSGRTTVTDEGEMARCGLYDRPSMDLLSNGAAVASFVNSAGELIYGKYTCPPIGRCGFVNQIIDTGMRYFESSTAMAIGNGDYPFILYHKFDGVHSHLRMAYQRSNNYPTWNKVDVDNSKNTYGPIAMEPDLEGNMHATFVDIPDHPHYSKYTLANGTWSTPTILDSTNYTMHPVRVAVNPKSNTPQVAFANNLDQLIVTAYGCLGQICLWNANTVDAPPDDAGTLGAPSIIIDSNGRRLLTYDYFSPQQGINGLKFMKIEGAVKTSQIIETTPGLVDSTSIALRPGDVPVIAYHLPALGQIKVAWGPVSVFLPLIRR